MADLPGSITPSPGSFLQVHQVTERRTFTLNLDSNNMIRSCSFICFVNEVIWIIWINPKYRTQRGEDAEFKDLSAEWCEGVTRGEVYPGIETGGRSRGAF